MNDIVARVVDTFSLTREQHPIHGSLFVLRRNTVILAHIYDREIAQTLINALRGRPSDWVGRGEEALWSNAQTLIGWSLTLETAPPPDKPAG